AEQTALAERLRAALAGDDYLGQLATAGLRDAAGAAGFAALPGAPDKVAAVVLDPNTVGAAVANWISVTLPSRMLAIIDVSGSMLAAVPTAGGATRGQISVAAAKQGLMLFDPTWSVG